MVQASTLNVAFNSHNKSLLTIMMSNNVSTHTLTHTECCSIKHNSVHLKCFFWIAMKHLYKQKKKYLHDGVSRNINAGILVMKCCTCNMTDRLLFLFFVIKVLTTFLSFFFFSLKHSLWKSKEVCSRNLRRTIYSKCPTVVSYPALYQKCSTLLVLF